MVAEMKQLAALATEQELSVEERNLLSVAYKNLVGARRASWRILQSVEQNEMMKNNEKRVAMIQKYRAVVEKELDDVSAPPALSTLATSARAQRLLEQRSPPSQTNHPSQQLA